METAGGKRKRLPAAPSNLYIQPFLNSNFDISIGLKGIVHLGIFFASNLTFWIVMIRGKGHLGHMGFKHF